MDITAKLADELHIKPNQAQNAIELLDAGNTIPFIARYRKEMTGSLDDQLLRELSERLTYLRNLEKRREEVSVAIEQAGSMTEELAQSLQNASTLAEIEDIYRPFRPKRRTRASIAKEKGLEPLADAIFAQQKEGPAPEQLAAPYVSEEKEIATPQEAIDGAKDILAERFSDDAALRKRLRSLVLAQGMLCTKAADGEDSVYRQYYEYTEPVRRAAHHRILAIDRGEREGFLKVSIELEESAALQIVFAAKVRQGAPCAECVKEAAEDSWRRLIFPSLEREVRGDLTERAAKSAIGLFAENLRHLLMQPPLKGKRVLALDPAYRTGCKVAVVDETGLVLDTGVVYPTPPHNKIEQAKKTLTELIEKYKVDVLSIGNGTASRETEIFAAGLIAELGGGLSYMVVSEAGASVYSASKLGAQEFPQFDVSLRSAVSIARRLQDPLAELCKIDPKAIGVGQYQHDMPQKELGEALDGVVEGCVNSVGVDLNTASAPLLAHVAGVGATLAKSIVAYREEQGAFSSRSELKKVPKLGPKAFEQCAGFLRVPESKNILDHTAVHPESYAAAKKLLEMCGYTAQDVAQGKFGGLRERIFELGEEKVAEACEVGLPTLHDITEELLRPGRDPRENLPPPLLRTDVMEMKDLKPGMELDGTVRNVTDFGAFVDIGVHQDGLVHISRLCDRFVKHPSEVVKTGDIVRVRVLEVDLERKRISLTMQKEA